MYVLLPENRSTAIDDLLEDLTPEILDDLLIGKYYASLGTHDIHSFTDVFYGKSS